MSEPTAVVTRLPVQPMAAAQRSVPAPVVAPATMQQRATHAVAGTQRAFRDLIPQLQYRLMRIGSAGLTGVVALIVAALVAVVVWLPSHQAEVALRTEWLQAAASGPATTPATAGVDHLVASLPTRAQIPAVLGQMLVEADKAGVALDKGHYDFRPPQSGALGRYAFEFPVKGSYPNVRDFIDRTLMVVPAAGLEKLRIERKTVGDTLINADIGFVVFVRGE
jgi:hypothetical protein